MFFVFWSVIRLDRLLKDSRKCGEGSRLACKLGVSVALTGFAQDLGFSFMVSLRRAEKSSLAHLQRYRYRVLMLIRVPSKGPPKPPKCSAQHLRRSSRYQNVENLHRGF